MLVRLDQGLSSDSSYPGGAKLFVTSGSSYVYADGGWVNLVPDCWVSVELDVDNPIFVDEAAGSYDSIDIRDIGIEIASGGSSVPVWSEATLHVDSVGYR